MKTLIGLLFITTTALADAKIPVNWNCYLPRDVMVCDEIKTSYLSSNSDIEIITGIKAKISISIRSTQLSNNTEYKFIFDGAEKLPDLEFPLTVNSNLSSGEISERIQKIMGNFTGIYRTALGQSVQESNSDDKPYYFVPSLDASTGKRQGSTSSSLNGSFTGNYSTHKWRLSGSGYFEQSSSDNEKTAYSVGIKTKTIWIGGDALIVKSYNKHWDVAIMVGNHSVDTDISLTEQDPTMSPNALKNKASKTYLKGGVEWLAVPFIEENSNGNVAIRYAFGKEFHDYVDPEDFEFVKESFFKHSLEVAANKHFKKSDVNFSIMAYTSTLRERPVSGISSSAGITYRVTPRLSVGGNYNIAYGKNRVPSPADSGVSFAGLTSDNKAALNYSGSINVKFTLGNSRLFSKEQRWKKN